jgi:8-oxo-dGTP pyrophosphatase MutT (NUDIX family)
VRIRLGWSSERLSERIAAIDAGQLAPAVPRDAATVMVLRQTLAGGRPPQTPPGNSPESPPGEPGDAPEVLMLRRPAAMTFAPGAYVFPGGSVDPADAGTDIGWVGGPTPEEFGEQLGCPTELARALVCAAVRETFEESGVLLAGGADGAPAEFDEPSLTADRAELAAGRMTFADVLARRGLVIRADLLTPWARWITPEAEPRRFDTSFFAAALPPGQRATGHNAEVDHIAWLRPEEAISAARAGSMLMLPPTAATLNEFAALGRVGEILASRRRITPIEPRLVVEDGETWLTIPDGLEHPL